jgi:hypothetical protein
MAVRGAVRAERGIDVATAATQVTTREVDGTIRIFGPRAARDALGLRESVNWVRPENSGLIAQGVRARVSGSLVSTGTLAGITLGLASDTQMYLDGEYDRHEYAAALTIDTGIAIGTSVIAGAVSGAVTGALLGGGAGTIALPIVGTVSGAVLGALAGFAAGTIVAVASGLVVQATGARPILVERVASLYRRWTGDGP